VGHKEVPRLITQKLRVFALAELDTKMLRSLVHARPQPPDDLFDCFNRRRDTQRSTRRLVNNSRLRAAVNNRRAPLNGAHLVNDLFAHEWLEKIFDNKEVGPPVVVGFIEARVNYLDVAT
jgi:hypothetical protein